VKEAVYCDMGPGWNYSWYRRDDGSVEELFTTPGRYTTNWITFRLTTDDLAEYYAHIHVSNSYETSGSTAHDISS